MNRIAAAENLVIETAPDEWRLLSYANGEEPDEVMHVSSGHPMTFNEAFAKTRRLPSAGRLPAQYIRQIVLGWSHEDDAWHLGLLLERELADIRGSRWCELANWPDPDPSVFRDLAQESGQTLADLLSVPFNLVPPRTDAVPAEAAAEPEAPLPELPINLGTWRLEQRDAQTLVFQRPQRWRTTRIVRVLAYAALAAIYLLLSVTTLRNDLALPNRGVLLPSPEILPYLGLVAAVVSVGGVLYTLYELTMRPNEILVDGQRKRISLRHGQRERWHVDEDDVEAVYVTHIVRSRSFRRQPVVRHGEINLYRTDGTFTHVLQQAVRDDETARWLTADDELEDTVKPLRATASLSELQAAGLYVARTLGDVSVWYDQRIH